MASLKEVKRVTELCEKYELEGRDVIKGYTNTQLGSMYNGIGPEKFPGWLRAVLDALHPSLAPVGKRTFSKLKLVAALKAADK